jgi:uncharacterized protein YecT (DUF1311 family)
MKTITHLFCLFLVMNINSLFGQVDVTGETELYNRYSVVDKILNRTYKQKLKLLRGTKRSDLISSQRAWIQRRDTICNGNMESNGVIENKLRLSCLIDETTNRVKLLKTWKT